MFCSKGTLPSASDSCSIHRDYLPDLFPSHFDILRTRRGMHNLGALMHNHFVPPYSVSPTHSALKKAVTKQVK